MAEARPWATSWCSARHLRRRPRHPVSEGQCGSCARPNAQADGPTTFRLVPRARRIGRSTAIQWCGCVGGFGASTGKPARGREPIYPSTSTSNTGSCGLPSLVGARRGRRRDALSESRMQGDPHVRFDEQGVETGRLVSPTGEPHDTAPLPDSTPSGPVQTKDRPRLSRRAMRLTARQAYDAAYNPCGLNVRFSTTVSWFVHPR
jgi:hypothetical protein